MAGINVPGIGSGLDISGMASGLAKADVGGRINVASGKIEKIDSKLSAMSSILAGLESFDKTLAGLGVGVMSSNKLSYSSESKIMNIEPKGYALNGNYEVEAIAIASAHMLKSEEFSEGQTFYGDLSVGVGSDSSFIAIPEGSSIYEVADLINKNSPKTMAVVINNGSGDVLSISSKSKGVDGTITIDGIDNANSDNTGLSSLDFNSYDSNLIQTRAASNSQIKINGVLVESSDNKFDDTISGLDISLNEGNAIDLLNTPQYFSIEEDNSKIFDNVNSFVRQFNGVIDGIKSYTKYDQAENKGAAFTGDGDVNRLLRDLQMSMVDRKDNGGSLYTSLYSIGIKSGEGGHFSIDRVAFDKALEDDKYGVVSLVSNGLGSNSDSVEITGELSDITTSFNKSVVINKKPVGSSSSSSASLSLDPDNTPITITSGIELNFDGAILASNLGGGGDDLFFNNYSELISQINKDLVAANIPIKASLESNFINGFYETNITFNQSMLSEGLLEISNISGLGSFGNIVSVATTPGEVSVDGVDTSYIRNFTIENDAIDVEINNDSVSQGESFNIFASKGFSHQLRDIIESFTGDDGIFKNKKESLDASKTRLDDEVKKLFEDQDVAEQRYLKQFQALDILLTRLKGDQDQLSAQLSQITNFNQNNN